MLTVTGHIEVSPERIEVSYYWEGEKIDRPSVGAMSCGSNRKLAERLKRAVDAQKVHLNPQIKTDINGKSYVSATITVNGRSLNADLKRLGY